MTQARKPPQPKTTDAVTNSASAAANRKRQEQSATRTKRDQTGNESKRVPSIVYRVLDSSGQSLDSATRKYFDPKFGYDFSSVRVHTDNHASQSAAALGARAYTYGNQIVFGSGQFAPETEKGQRLLAHELTHTIQQRGASPGKKSAIEVAETDAAELEAERSTEMIFQDAIPKISQHDRELVIRRASATKSLTAKGAKKKKRKKKSQVLSAKTKGIQAHKVISDDFKRKVGTATSSMNIPGATSKDVLDSSNIGESVGFRDNVGVDTEGRSIGDVTREHISKSSKSFRSQVGVGKPDLVARPSKERIELAEIKPNNERGIQLGWLQVDNYIEKANAPENLEWRLRRKFAKSVEDQPFKRMPKSRYQRSDPILIHGDPYEVSWHSDGLLLYKAMDTDSLSDEQRQKLKADVPTEDYQIEGPAPKRELFTLRLGSRPGYRVWMHVLGRPVGKQELAVGGVIFRRVQKLKRKYDNVECVPATKKETSEGLPIEYYQVGSPLKLKLDKESRQLLEGKTKKQQKFEYPGASPGAFTSISYHPDRGLSGEGYIKPTIPLLKGSRIKVAFEGNRFYATADLKKKAIRMPPGFRVTEAKVNFELSPEFKPSGILKFQVGPKNKPLADGKVEVGADSQGFYAMGDLAANIPGFDAATAKVTYRKETGWEGNVKLNTSLGFVRNAEAKAEFSKRGLVVTGGMEVSLPGGQSIKLTAAKKGRNRVLFFGHGVFKVPGGKLKPVHLHFGWDGKNLTGKGKTGFTFKGFDGQMDLKYRNGKVSGEGTLDFEKGKTKGKIHLKMSPRQKFSGEGNVTYQLTPNLIGNAGISIDEKEKVTLKGGLDFPKPIQLFEPKGSTKEIFSVSRDIPIPGASIAGYGINARIGGSLSAGYQLGPGELQNVKLHSMVNPFEEDPDLKIDFTANLHVGASTHISGTITGGVGIDIGLAEAFGTVDVTARADLVSQMNSPVSVKYRSDRFTVDAHLQFEIALMLGLALAATVSAEAGVGPFTVSKKKTWNLADYRYDPGLKIGIQTLSPARYDSIDGFSFPSPSQVKVTKPDFKADDIIKRLFKSARGKET